VGPSDTTAPPLGSGGFEGSRTGLDVTPLAEIKQANADKSTMAPSNQATFDPTEVTVIYVLGGPGAGKGTQCARLVTNYGFVHLSAGDLLRAEQNRQGSQYGQLIQTHIREGIVVPKEITIKLLKKAMHETITTQGSKLFLIDGFPRKMDQALEFDKAVCPAALVLFLNCPEPTMLDRLLERGKTSGRDDDNVESIKKRFRTFIDTSMPVIDYYRGLGRILEVDSSKSIDAVDQDLKQGIETKLHIVPLPGPIDSNGRH